MYYLYLVVLFLNVMFCSCLTSTIVIYVVEVGSTEDITFVCNLSPSTNLTRWTYLSGSTGISLMSYQNGQCTVSPSESFLRDDHRYSYTCTNTVHQVTIHSYLDRYINNRILTCRDAVQYDRSRSTWMIKIVQDGDQCNCDQTISFNISEVTEGGNVTLICRVSSDVAVVIWNKFGSSTAAMRGQNGTCTTSPYGTTFLDNTSKYIYTCNNTVYQVTILNIQRSEHYDMHMCIPVGQPEGMGSNWIIKVRARVTSVTMTPAVNRVNVIENTAVELTCITSTARPAASVYWYIHPNGNSNDITRITDNITATTDYNDISVITSTLHFVPTRQHNDMKIYCEANNSVNTSPVQSNREILLNVLYKADDPYILQDIDFHVIENTPETLSCTVKGGNPTPTLSWSCTKFSPTNRSTIDSNGNVTTSMTWNVSRTHEGTCTCVSTQTPFRTETTGVSIVVVYAVIVSFSINGFIDDIVTVDEGTAVIAKCVTEGNPIPEMTLTNGTNVLVSKTSRLLEYNLSHISCQDIGTYSCSARNELNAHTVVLSKDLVVHCSPRPIGDKDEEILSGIGLAVKISIEVIAYPTPSFTWWSQVNDQWKLIQPTDRQLINSSGLLSSLTINNVNEDDFTSYKVVAENSVGIMKHIYKLREGSPDVPTQLKHFEALTTSSTIQLAWTPGYNGGSTQIFYIKYKSTNESSWKYKIVSDDLEQTRIYTLTHLNDDMYYYIIVLASNQFGNSTESSLLIANTKEKETTERPTKESSNIASMIGGIVGGVIALVAVLSVVFILIRKRLSSEGCLKQPDTCQQTESANQCMNEPSTITLYDDIERENEYEMINQGISPSRPYSSLQELDNITQTERNRENTYENTI